MWAIDPLLRIPDQFRLAGIYERLGNAERARHWYGRFLEDWGQGDADIPELAQARSRLAELAAAGERH